MSLHSEASLHVPSVWQVMVFVGPLISKFSKHATVTVLPMEYQGCKGVTSANTGSGVEHKSEGKNVNN